MTVEGKGFAGPIEIVQDGKQRVLRLSKRHQKLDQNIILALLGPEWMNELSVKAFSYCDAERRNTPKRKTGWKPLSIAVKHGQPEIKVEIISHFFTTIRLTKRPTRETAK